MSLGSRLRGALRGFREDTLDLEARLGVQDKMKGAWVPSQTGGGGYFGAKTEALADPIGGGGRFYQVQNDWFTRLLDTGSTEGISFNALSAKCLSNPFGGRCMRYITDTLADVKLEVVKEGEGGKRDVATDHPLLEMMYTDERTPLGFLEPFMHYLHFAGEVFMYRPLSLTSRKHRPLGKIQYICPSTFVRFIIKGKELPEGFRSQISDRTWKLKDDGEILGFVFTKTRTSGFTGLYQASGQHWKSVDEVKHIYRHNPNKSCRGLPLILGAKDPLISMALATMWNQNLSKTGGRIPGFFVPEGMKPGQSITPEQRDRIEADFDARARERQMNNLAMVMSGTMKFVEANISPREAEFLEGDKYNGRKICIPFGVPPILAGDVESVGLGGGSGTDSAERFCWNVTLLPLLRYFVDEINWRFMRPFMDGYELGFVKERIEALQEDEQKKARRLVEACGGPYLSVNESRREGGHEPSPDPKHDEIREPKKPGEGKGGDGDDEGREPRDTDNNNKR